MKAVKGNFDEQKCVNCPVYIGPAFKDETVPSFEARVLPTTPSQHPLLCRVGPDHDLDHPRPRRDEALHPKPAEPAHPRRPAQRRTDVAQVDGARERHRVGRPLHGRRPRGHQVAGGPQPRAGGHAAADRPSTRRPERGIDSTGWEVCQSPA